MTIGSPFQAEAARAIVGAAARDGRSALLEHEGYALLQAFGVDVPLHRFVAAGQPARDALAALPGSRVVVKAVSPTLLHKSDVGGVAIVAREPEVVDDAIADMHRRIAGLTGTLLVEWVPHAQGFAREWLVGARLTREFGPVLTVGAGGVLAEAITAQLREDGALAIFSPGLPGIDRQAVASRAAAIRLAVSGQRGAPPLVEWASLERTIDAMLRLAAELPALGLRDVEINPLVISDGRLVAIDALATLGAADQETTPRPLAKLQALLHPRHVAVVGVSDQVNPGRIILRNLLRDGFAPEQITVVKPGRSEIDGCRCVPSLAALATPVDLLVLAVSAAQSAQLLTDAVATQAAAAVVLIPGGFEEKAGSESLATAIRAELERARATPDEGPLVLGGNCLGFRSAPGRCDTLFIADRKLPRGPVSAGSGTAPAASSDPLAVVSQSGAFAITRMSRWTTLRPAYVITTGNQLDLTVGDCLEWLSARDTIRVHAVYVEGFRTGDGLKAARATAAISARGGHVVIYRAGRTPAGAQASASHTASLAGDYRVTRTLFEQAGALVADDIEQFEDLVRLAVAWPAWRGAGRRLAAVSNAGFECVAIADSLGGLSLARFEERTIAALGRVFRGARLDAVVDVHNPLDLTPMAGDAAYEAALRAVLSDEGVDAAVLGCVPLTVTMRTLPAPADEGEDFTQDDALPARLARVAAELRKPFVVVVDAGPLYDPFAAAIEAAGLVVFRTADRAMRALARFLAPRG